MSWHWRRGFSSALHSLVLWFFPLPLLIKVVYQVISSCLNSVDPEQVPLDSKDSESSGDCPYIPCVAFASFATRSLLCFACMHCALVPRPAIRSCFCLCPVARFHLPTLSLAVRTHPRPRMSAAVCVSLCSPTTLACTPCLLLFMLVSTVRSCICLVLSSPAPTARSCPCLRLLSALARVRAHTCCPLLSSIALVACCIVSLIAVLVARSCLCPPMSTPAVCSRIRPLLFPLSAIAYGCAQLVALSRSGLLCRVLSHLLSSVCLSI